MELVNSYGPLIESGTIDGFTYEVRGDDLPMIYVYRKTGNMVIGNATQLGGTDPENLARMLIAELPKRA